MDSLNTMESGEMGQGQTLPPLEAFDHLVIEPEAYELGEPVRSSAFPRNGELDYDAEPSSSVLSVEEVLDYDAESSSSVLSEEEALDHKSGQDEFQEGEDKDYDSDGHEASQLRRDLELTRGNKRTTFRPRLPTVFEAFDEDASAHSCASESSLSEDSQITLQRQSPHKSIDDQAPVKTSPSESLLPQAAEGPGPIEGNRAGISSTTASSLKRVLLEIIKQRDTLQTRLVYAMSAFGEQQEIINEFDEIAAASQAMLFQGMEAKTQATLRSMPKARKGRNTWIGGTWLAGTCSTIRSAEHLWETGHTQEALTRLSQVIRTKDISAENLINAKLLQVAILRSSGQEEQALQFAESAVRMAYASGMVALAGKAQFHRALTLLYLDRYTESSWCFLLASHTPDHAAQIEVNRQIAETKRRELPSGDARRFLPLSFMTYMMNTSVV